MNKKEDAHYCGPVTEAAIKSYEKGLAFKPEDENALAQLEVLWEKGRA